MTKFKVKLSPKDEDGKQRILKFIANKPRLMFGGTYVVNPDGSADFQWTFANIPPVMQGFARRNFRDQLDEAIKRKDNLSYEVLVE